MEIVLARAHLIESYNRAHQKLITTLVKCPRIMWDFKPAADTWSIREIIAHLADSEAHAYIRARRILAEPGRDVIAFDQDLWARELDYSAQEPDDALEFFRLARRMTTALLRRQPEEAWHRTTHHPERGEITLDDWLEGFTRHPEAHLEQITRVFKAWQRQNPSHTAAAHIDPQPQMQQQ